MVDVFVPGLQLTPTPPLYVKREVSSDYTVLIIDNEIIVDGDADISLLSLEIAINPLVVRTTPGSTATLVPFGSDPLETGASPVTSTVGVRISPTDDGWVQT